MTWEYCIVEWLWDAGNIRCTLPAGGGFQKPGSYAELVDVLTDLGHDGWEVASCAAGGNWLFWTLKRQA
ncbi:MAG: hypothetical protein KKA73_28720 [Chloroflexi bacterium]|nr:hypothetical protein [Chloroflexota bacterium]MBU1751678.1 hypothetical protein [Chloroflexota bacterium]